MRRSGSSWRRRPRRLPSTSASPRRSSRCWPGRARAVSRFFWQKLAKTYDASPNRLFFVQPKLTVAVRLLGATWCVQDEQSGALKLHDGSELKDVNPAPTLSVYGPWDPAKREFQLLDFETVEYIGSMVNTRKRTPSRPAWSAASSRLICEV